MSEGSSEVSYMARVTLIGGDVALLEGLAQSLAALGHIPTVAGSLAEAREVSAAKPPLVLVADRALASASGHELLNVPLAAGGARLLYRTASSPLVPLIPALQRSILADLTLPLERHRLAALIQSIGDRARLTGRAPRHTPTEGRAL
jgi:DNA-binding NtrC family response regulator